MHYEAHHGDKRRPHRGARRTTSEAPTHVVEAAAALVAQCVANRIGAHRHLLHERAASLPLFGGRRFPQRTPLHGTTLTVAPGAPRARGTCLWAW